MTKLLVFIDMKSWQVELMVYWCSGKFIWVMDWVVYSLDFMSSDPFCYASPVSFFITFYNSFSEIWCLNCQSVAITNTTFIQNIVNSSIFANYSINLIKKCLKEHSQPLIHKILKKTHSNSDQLSWKSASSISTNTFIFQINFHMIFL